MKALAILLALAPAALLAYAILACRILPRRQSRLPPSFFPSYPPKKHPIRKTLGGFKRGTTSTVFRKRRAPLSFPNPLYCAKSGCSVLPGLPPTRVFADWPEALAAGESECAIVALPDRLHFPAAQAALAQGLHVLLEKPVGATWEECVALDAAVRERGRLVQVGHILRFTPYYAKIAELIRGGTLGEVVSIRHLEPVGYGKAAQAFCRGPFGNTVRSTPMILQKCSHDFDFFAWWIGRRCLFVQSFGERSHFRPEATRLRVRRRVASSAPPRSSGRVPSRPSVCCANAPTCVTLCPTPPRRGLRRPCVGRWDGASMRATMTPWIIKS